MKIKSLQINVLALLFGLIAVCISHKTEASNATNSPEGQTKNEQTGDDFSNQNLKTPKLGAARTLNWTFRGPDDVSGIVTSVVHHHSNNTLIVYVGAAHNGVWKSTEGGAGNKSWKKIPVENNKNLYVTCLALDTTSNTIYAGTGGILKGQGVYKAEGDGPLKLMAGSENWTHIYKIVFSDNKLYAATNAGLMCYIGGKWNVCTEKKGDDNIPLNDPVSDISINESGLVIIAMNKSECYISEKGDPYDFKYKTVADISINTTDNIAVATSPTNNNVLYIVAARPIDGKVHKVLLSEDKGNTWEVILAYNSSSQFIDPLEGNGININYLLVDPRDPYTIYIASRNIWKGKRYTPGTFDFGLSAISKSNVHESDFRYLHSNVRSISFYSAPTENVRFAYIATDGGLYNAFINIAPDGNIIIPNKPLHCQSLIIGSYDYVTANNNNWILMGTPTLGVQAMDANTNYPTSARPVWDLFPAEKTYITEGSGGPCAISMINENFYIYSLFTNGALIFRRSIDCGKQFQPTRQATPTIEWFAGSSDMPDPKYKNAPMIMWENFNDDNTYDTVWFKADTLSNFSTGDRIIYANSKNFDYPIEYSVPYGFAHKDSIQVLDPVQNRTFFGLLNKIWMTRDALQYSKNSSTTPVEWLLIATLDSKDTSVVFGISDDANTLYTGTSQGNIHCLNNLKKVYNTTTINLIDITLSYSFEGKKIRAIAVDPIDPNHVVVVVVEGSGNNIYESFNGTSESATYNSIKYNLPDYVFSVLLPKGAKKGTIIVGTEKGIWMKDTGSDTWISNNNGLGEVPVMTLFQITTHRPGVKNVPYYDWENNKLTRINYPSNNSTYLTIYAGTYGSGIFSTDQYVGIDEFTTNDPKESDALVVFPNPINDIATIEIDITKGQATIQVFSVDGRCVKEQKAKSTINIINLKGYTAGTYIIQVTQGDVVKSAKVVKQ